MVASLFAAGHEIVILDATNTVARYREEWLDERWDCRHVLFMTSCNTCIQRALSHNQDYLVPVIERMYQNFDRPTTFYSPKDFVDGQLWDNLLRHN